MIKKSLYGKLFRRSLIAFLVALVFYFAAAMVMERVVDRYYLAHDNTAELGEKMIPDFASYIEEGNVASDDLEAITEWVRMYEVANMQIFKEGNLYYDSAYPTQTEWKNNPEAGYYDDATPQDVAFADQTLQVAIYAFGTYRLYDYATIGELICSFLIFIAILMWGIRRSIKYVMTLMNDIEYLHQGNLDHQVTIIGEDELGRLAVGLDRMREGLKEEKERNKTVVTTLSHKLGNPLTIVLMYAELISQDNFKNEKDRQYALETLVESSERVRNVAEELIQYMLSGKEENE